MTKSFAGNDELATVLRRKYDEQLRGDAEFGASADFVRHGPLWWGSFGGNYGFISYRDLPQDPTDLDELIAASVRYYQTEPIVMWSNGKPAAMISRRIFISGSLPPDSLPKKKKQS